MLSLNAFLVYSTIAFVPLTSSAPVHRSNFVLPDILFNVKTARQNWLQAQKFFTRGEHLRDSSHGTEYPSIVCPSSIAASESEPIIASIGETAVGNGELEPVLVCPTQWVICQYSMVSKISLSKDGVLTGRFLVPVIWEVDGRNHLGFSHQCILPITCCYSTSRHHYRPPSRTKFNLERRRRGASLPHPIIHLLRNSSP